MIFILQKSEDEEETSSEESEEVSQSTGSWTWRHA